MRRLVRHMHDVCATPYGVLVIKGLTKVSVYMYIESILFQQYKKYKRGDKVIMFSTVMYIESILLFQK